MNRIAAIAIAALLLTAVPVAFAGRGGNGGGGSGATAANITFAPTSVAVGQQYQVNGSGFRPNAWVTVGAHYADTTWWNYQMTDGQGKFSLTFTATTAGQIYHEAKEQDNQKLRVMATGTLTVNP